MKKKIDQLQFILIVKNLKNVIQKDSSKKYTEILIDLLRMRNKDAIDDIHGMMKIEKRFVFDTFKESNVEFHRFYNISSIVRTIHVVSNIEKMSNVKYINSFLEWENYQKFHDSNFLRNDVRTVRKIRSKIVKNIKNQILWNVDSKKII